MSVSMTRADGVTVLTLTSDPESACPPLCQILKNLCYSPVLCSVSQHLRKVQTNCQSVLGTLQIMVGLLNVGLGAILLCSASASGWQMDDTKFPLWLGGLFVFFGIINILSEKFPSPCLVILNVILNLAGVGFAIAAIVLYSINIADVNFWWMCRDDYSSRRLNPSVNPDWDSMNERCLSAKALALKLSRGVNAVLIILSALELCLVISSVVMGIKALRSKEKRGSKNIDDPEGYKPLMDEVTSNPAA